LIQCSLLSAEPLPVEKEEKTIKDDKIVGSTPPLYVLLVFISCVVSSMVFCYKPEISIAFERQVDDIMTSTQLYSFEISLVIAFIVLVTTKVCMASDNMKAKLIQYVWATFVCILVGFVVFFLTETKSEISPSKHSDAINDNNHVEKKNFFQNLFKMKRTT
jgi:heme/copper-type cytochrome/quinol oxidase subunit 2